MDSVKIKEAYLGCVRASEEVYIQLRGLCDHTVGTRLVEI